MRRPRNQRRPARHASPREKSAARWVRVVAWALCGVTFPLLWVGGLVTTTKSGMAVPDWPGTYGYNLFLYPWTAWLYGPWDLFVEHGHRLLGSLAGLLTIVLLLLVWRYDQRNWMKVVGIAALVGVVAQGVLGGLRVVLDERLLAMLHGSTGPAFFALTVAIAVWTTRSWREAKRQQLPALSKLAPLATLACLLTYVQMLLGAMLRHMPVTAGPQSFMAIVEGHLFFAAMVTLFTLLVAAKAIAAGNPAAVRRGGQLALGVLGLQLLLGLVTWITKFGTPVWLRGLLPISRSAAVADGWLQSHLVTAHQATGSLLFVTLLAIALWAWRYAPQTVSAVQDATLPKGVVPA